MSGHPNPHPQQMPGQPGQPGQPASSGATPPSGALPMVNFGQQPMPSQPGYGQTGYGQPVDTVDFSTPGTPATWQPTPKPSRRPLKAVLATATAALLGAGALGAYQFGVFGATGNQPDTAIPSNAIAYAAIDLNPSAGQKVAAYRFLRNFPDLNVSDQDSIKESVVGELLAGNPFGLTYEDDIEPWLGDRAAVALTPNPASPMQVTPILAFEVTDEDAMREALESVETGMLTGGADVPPEMADMMNEAVAATPGTGLFGYAVRGDYVLLAPTQAEADTAASQPTTLADNTSYSTQTDDLPDGRIFTAWADLTSLAATVPTGLLDAPTAAQMTGAVALSGSFESDALTIEGATTNTAALSSLTTTTGTGLIKALPDTSTIAVSGAGLGDAIEAAWPSIAALDFFGIAQDAAQMGIDLPQDLSAVFGSEFALGVDLAGEKVAALATTPDPDKAIKTLKKAADILGEPVAVDEADNGYALASDADTVTNMTTRTDGLGTSDTFTNAVSDPDAGMVLFLDIDALIATFDTYAPQGMDSLDALGVTADNDGTRGTFTARLTLD